MLEYGFAVDQLKLQEQRGHYFRELDFGSGYRYNYCQLIHVLWLLYELKQNLGVRQVVTEKIFVLLVQTREIVVEHLLFIHQEVVALIKIIINNPLFVIALLQCRVWRHQVLHNAGIFFSLTAILHPFSCQINNSVLVAFFENVLCKSFFAL